MNHVVSEFTTAPAKCVHSPSATNIESGGYRLEGTSCTRCRQLINLELFKAHKRIWYTKEGSEITFQVAKEGMDLTAVVLGIPGKVIAEIYLKMGDLFPEIPTQRI